MAPRATAAKSILSRDLTLSSRDEKDPEVLDEAQKHPEGVGLGFFQCHPFLQGLVELETYDGHAKKKFELILKKKF